MVLSALLKYDNVAAVGNLTFAHRGPLWKYIYNPFARSGSIIEPVDALSAIIQHVVGSQDCAALLLDGRLQVGVMGCTGHHRLAQSFIFRNLWRC